MLTDQMINDAKPREKPYKMADCGGMYLLIHSNGSRYWRLDYRHNGLRKTKALGIYPQVSIEAARESRDKFKSQLPTNNKLIFSWTEASDEQLIAELKRRKLINF